MRRKDKKLLGLVVMGGLIVWILTAKKAEALPAHGLKGDLDNDGTVQRQDLFILQDLVAGYITIEWVAQNAPIPMTVEEALWRADVNGDGVINSLDITALELRLGV